MTSAEKAGTFLNNIYQVLIDSLNNSQDEELANLHLNCAHMLILVMSLNNRKYYIPGETIEKAQLRQHAIDYGVFIILTFIHLNTESA